MTHHRIFRAAGTIDRRAGAAAAALKARAAAWEMPLVETATSLSLSIWGSELRLIAEPQGWRIELSAPEQRLIGTLRDSATELFADAGLAVAWDHVDVGALAPGLSLARVASVAPRGASFLRLRLVCADAARFAQGGLHLRLLLPPAGRPAVWPRVASTGRTAWPEGADALHRPVYTVAGQAGDSLDIDIFRHAGSPTCDWALSDPTGQQVGLIGPGGGGCPDAPRLLFCGDETALPAIARMLAGTGGEARAVLRCAPADLGALADDPRVTRSDDPLAAILRLNGPDDIDHAWFAGHADAARAARQHLLARGFARTAFTAAAYWG